MVEPAYWQTLRAMVVVSLMFLVVVTQLPSLLGSLTLSRTVPFPSAYARAAR